MEKLTLVKVGGKIVEEKESLDALLASFNSLDGLKVLVHGGGRSATRIASQLGIESRMVGGRRVTDEDMLQVVTMVYGGLVNKRDGVEYIISDDKAVLEFYYQHKDDTLEQLADAVCSKADWWGMDMHDLPTFVETVKKYVAIIETEGMHAAIEAAAK